jgi:N-acetylneuraminic acid mutarotase
MYTTKCEIYSIKSNTWRLLPELPEERYKCFALADDNTDYVYLFGGINVERKENYTTIIKLNLKSNMLWEDVVVANNSHLLAKNSSALMKLGNTIYILGGVDNTERKTDEIVEYDLSGKIAFASKKCLIKPSSFCQVNPSDLNKNLFYIFDDEFKIHKIAKNEFKFSLIDYNEC